VRLLKSDDVRVICERSLTPRLFRLIFATQAACRKAAAEDDEDKPTERVEVSHIRIEGGRASAHAELVGGDSAGAKGELSLAKRGGSWRGDDFSPAFLRSLVNTSLRNDDEVPRAVRRCIGNRFAQIPDARFKRLAYSLIGHQPQATTRLLETLSACERKRGGRSSVRRRLEQNVRKELGQAGASGVEVGCVLRRLRTTLPDALVIKLVSDKSRRSKARITRELVSAAIACGAGNPSDPGELSPA